MYELKLGTSTDQVTFLGETIAAPFRGGVLKQSSAGSSAARDIGIVEEIYDILLEDTPANINTALASLQRIFNQAVSYNRRRFGKPVYL